MNSFGLSKDGCRVSDYNTRFESLCHHHHAFELLKIDLAIAIYICFFDYLVNFVVGKFFAQACHDHLHL
jgi:hypothetical protein